MNDACGCCQGIEPLTPVALYNRPGLNTLRYRAGTHAAFLESMLARLSSSAYPALDRLTTRERHDPAIALLDAWATVADVLTFYQERIANEGYLRTATERRSILELARLVGYKLRPGVAASVFLAYTLDDNIKDEVLIPQGARVQSVPGPGELPQTFEIGEPLVARREWNNLRPRLSRPQNITLDNILRLKAVYFKGTATNLKAGDRLLFVFGSAADRHVMRKVQEATPDFAAGRTRVTLQPVPFWVPLAVILLSSFMTALGEQVAKELEADTPDLDLIEAMERVHSYVAEALETLWLGRYAKLPRISYVLGRVAFIHWYKIPGIGASMWGTMRVAVAMESVMQATLASVMQAAAELLNESAVRRQVACGLADFINEARATSRAQRQNLLGQQLAALLPGYLLFWNWVKGKDEAAPLLGALKNLLSVTELYTSLNAFLVETYGSPMATGLLNHIKEFWTWLETIKPAEYAGCADTSQPIATVGRLATRILVMQPTPQPRASTYLPRSTRTAMAMAADTIPQLLVTSQPALRNILYKAWSGGKVSEARPALDAVYALRLSAPVFGYNAAPKMALKQNDDPELPVKFIAQPDGDWSPSAPGPGPAWTDELPHRLFLDNAYDAVAPGGFAVIENPEVSLAARILLSQTRPRSAYNVSGKTTQLDLSREWWQVHDAAMKFVRETIVHAASEELALAEAPVTKDVSGNSVELDAIYDGLISGRWLIVSGEVTDADLPGTSGVRMSELAMLAAAEQTFDPDLPGDKAHTKITFYDKLAHQYKRDTVTIYANVVKATHGETRTEALGNGDGSAAWQSFALKQPPLTYVAAPTPAGAASTLVVRVNQVQWHEKDTFSGLGPADRAFITETGDDAKTTVIFGDGRHGARLPSGAANVVATYRNGIGKAGNVKAGQISLLMTRPLGVKEAINPLPASGGADKEDRDQARQNAPLAIMALDRVVSVQDYADFARTFAGIGKASAARLPDGHGETVYVTIAGADDIPIDKHSDLYGNLLLALRNFGDPYQPFRVEMRELLLLIIQASVRLMPDYTWEAVEPEIRRTLLETFGFQRRELGQDVTYGEVVSAIQAVPGVAYADLDVLDTASQEDILAFLAQTEKPDLIAFLKVEGEEQPRKRVAVQLARRDSGAEGGIAPAQLAILSPDVPDTLILNLVKEVLA